MSSAKSRFYRLKRSRRNPTFGETMGPLSGAARAAAPDPKLKFGRSARGIWMSPRITDRFGRPFAQPGGVPAEGVDRDRRRGRRAEPSNCCYNCSMPTTQRNKLNRLYTRLAPGTPLTSPPWEYRAISPSTMSVPAGCNGWRAASIAGRTIRPPCTRVLRLANGSTH